MEHVAIGMGFRFDPYSLLFLRQGFIFAFKMYNEIDIFSFKERNDTM